MPYWDVYLRCAELCSESQPRADSPDAGRPKTLPLDQSSTHQQSRSSSITGSATAAATLPSHLKTRRSLAAESVSDTQLRHLHEFGAVFRDTLETETVKSEHIRVDPDAVCDVDFGRPKEPCIL